MVHCKSMYSAIRLTQLFSLISPPPLHLLLPLALHLFVSTGRLLAYELGSAFRAMRTVRYWMEL